MSTATRTVEQALLTAVSDHRAGRLPQAETGYREVLASDPDNVVALRHLAMIAAGVGKLADAARLVQRALSIAPDFAEAHNDLGILYGRGGRMAEAEASFRRAVQCKPEFAEALGNLGTYLVIRGRAAEALPHLRKAASLAQLSPDTLINYGLALVVHGKLDEAERQFLKAHAKMPSGSTATNLGNLLKQQGRLTEAMTWFERAIELAPEVAESHHNRALALLLLGDYAEGWREHEWRRGNRRSTLSGRDYRAPIWKGQRGTGTLFVYPEQGLGDTIQFIRFLPAAARRCRQILFECPPRLRRLLETFAAANGIEFCDAPPAEFDAHTSLMSLPHALEVTLDMLGETAAPYLDAEPSLVETWRDRLGPKGQFRIGLAWQGSPTYHRDAERSIPLQYFAPLLSVPGTRLVSLQKGYGSEQIAHFGAPILDLANELDAEHAFVDTAALMASLDLVVTSDTAIAHLAGALGVRTWLLLPFVPDWRWLMDRDDSPWYPSMKVFRQSKPGDWSGVVRAVVRELNSVVAPSP